MIGDHHVVNTKRLITLVIITLLNTVLISAHVISNTRLVPRSSSSTLSAPQGYTLSWQKQNLRASVKTKPVISYSTLEKSGSITQTSLNSCVKKCNDASHCVFIQLFQVQNSTQGSVYCGLYSEDLTASAATSSKGPKNGTVVRSYGLKGPVKTFPRLPTGASLFQLDPCNANATVPLLVNNQYNSSDASAAYIIQHGIQTNPSSYFSILYPLLKNSSILVAPGLYETNHAAAPSSFYQPAINLAWEASPGSWTGGDDAVAPTNVSCSSFDVYDALLEHFSDTSLFPNLEKVYFVGHSAGGNALSRYSQVYDGQYSFSIRWIIANPASNAYFTKARPESDVCDSAYDYSYQMAETDMNRYVKSAYDNGQINFIKWIGRDIVTLIGQNDTEAAFPGGIQNCQSTAQGGVNRRDRNYAWWAYKNILAGTSNTVSNYYGYNQLIKSGATPILGASLSDFNHQNCNIANVGHQAKDIVNSSCGNAALFDDTVASGPDP